VLAVRNVTTPPAVTVQSAWLVESYVIAPPLAFEVAATVGVWANSAVLGVDGLNVSVGTAAGVTLFDAAEGELEPTPFVSITVNV
jgi:hypothetical protein